MDVPKENKKIMESAISLNIKEIKVVFYFLFFKKKFEKKGQGSYPYFVPLLAQKKTRPHLH